MTSHTAVLVILEKIASKDKDFRYMATSDLLNELQKEAFKVDAELEKKLCGVVLTQLEDSSGDISNLAVRCLGLLVRKVTDARAEEMIRSLCDKVITGKKEEQREIASIGLKTVIAEVPGGALASTAATLVTAKMLEGMVNKEDVDVVNGCLEILMELISKFGALVTADHARLQAVLLPCLDDPRAQLRKRGLHCLTSLSAYLSDDLLSSVITHLLTRLGQRGLKPDVARTYIQTVGQISRAVAYRFGKHLGTAVPLVTSYCDAAAEADDELRELSLQALENLVSRCPHDARPHLVALLATSLKYLKFDPNFADDMETEGGGDDSEPEEEDDDGEQYSDDEDVSWKVRRAAAKVLAALIAAYPDALPEVYAAAAPELVARFREREENVKSDVFQAFVVLLGQVGTVARRYAEGDVNSPLALVQRDAAGVLKTAARQLRDKSIKTRVGVFLVLRQLVTVLPSSVAPHVALLVPGIMAALHDKSSSGSNLKIEALAFLRLVMASSPPQVFQPHAKLLSAGIFACVNERYYKVSAEALRVCEVLMVVLRPDMGAPVPADLAPLVGPLHSTIMARLSAQDQDQEVKETAILAMATELHRLADVIKDEVPAVLRLLLDRLRNEVTRLAAVRAFTTICQSPLALDVSPMLEPALQELTSFLRKANRPLRAAALAALEAVSAKYGASFTDVGPYVSEAAVLVSDADLSLAALALRFFITLVQRQPALATTVVDKILPVAMQLVRSPLLQGNALDALQHFFAALAASGAPSAAAGELLEGLLDAGAAAAREPVSAGGGGGRQAQRSIAQCVAVLVSSGAPGQPQETVGRLLMMVKRPADAGSQRLALLCLGQIGRRNDLSALPAVEAAIASSLASPAEEIKGAASLALGGVACGNLSHYMPSLLLQVSSSQTTPKQQYLLLQALNEVITTLNAVGRSFGAGDCTLVLELLLNNCEGEEECRNVVAECLGRLAQLHPEPVLAALLERVPATSVNVRGVVVSAVKWAVTDKPGHPVDAPLHASLITFLSLMSDVDHHVRRAAVVALAAAAHHKASLVAGRLDQLLAPLYLQTIIREDMIRIVDLGPFKHKIDDGLELRKSAFECLDILLDACRDQLSASLLLSHLESGLRDHYDIKMPCHLTLSKLARDDGAAVLGALASLVEPLEKTLTAKTKSDAVKQEIDRHEDMLRSCLRAVDALAHIPGVDTCAAFQAMMKKVVLVGPLKDKYAQIEAERAEAEGKEAPSQ